jgi:hypothetical protein
MMAPPKPPAYVLAHPEAWHLFALLEQGRVDRYEQVRKTLGLHPQAFLRLVDRLSGFDLIWVRGDGAARRPRGGPVPVHMELAPRGRAMLEILQTMERAVEMHREKLGVRTAHLFSVPT